MAELAAPAGLDALIAVLIADPNPPARINDPRVLRDGEIEPADVGTDAVDGRTLSYVLTGQVGEGAAGFVNQPGGSQTYRLHCWAATPAHAMRVAAWVYRLVHGRNLTLTGHTVWACQVRILPGGPDPDGTAHQVIAEVAMETTEGA